MPKRSPPRMLEVLDVQRITPSVLRVALGGDELRGLAQCWPAAHIKLFFPRGAQTQPVLPTLDAQGRPVWPPPLERPIVRTYSVRRHDVEAGRLEVDFVLHEPAGPASTWAQRAVPGTRIGFAGPGGPRPLLPDADWALLAGDLSALPAIGALLEAMPRDARGHAFVQIPAREEAQALSRPPGVELTWLVHPHGEGGGGDLVASVAGLRPPEGEPFAWVAGEGGQVVSIRDYLLRAWGLPKTRMYAIPYWKLRLDEEQYHEERHRVMDELAAP